MRSKNRDCETRQKFKKIVASVAPGVTQIQNTKKRKERKKKEKEREREKKKKREKCERKTVRETENDAKLVISCLSVCRCSSYDETIRVLAKSR